MVPRFTHMNHILKAESCRESIKHLKIGRLKVKIRADGRQTFVFRNRNWQITNTKDKNAFSALFELNVTDIHLFSFQVTADRAR